MVDTNAPKTNSYAKSGSQNFSTIFKFRRLLFVLHNCDLPLALFNISTLLTNIDIDIDKDNLENIDTDTDIDKTLLQNIDIPIDIDKDNLGNIDIDRDYLENIVIDIEIDKDYLENINIDIDID